MNQQVTATDILQDPNWHLCHLELSSYTATFAYVSRQIIDTTPFLDQRFFSQFPGNFIKLDLRLFAKFPNNRKQVINYIFHTAFCGSTLLSRCLNIEGNNLSLSEPEVLLQLANFKRNHPEFAKSQDWLKILATVVHLLARPFNRGEKVIIKPTNSANNLIADLSKLNIDSKALFLSSSLNEFFISNIKKGSGYVDFCQLLIKCFSMDSDYLNKNNINDVNALSDLEKAALAWHMQQDNFESALNRAKNDFGKTLSIKEFLDNPKQSLELINEHFSLQLKDGQINAILAGKAFNTHSKGESGDYNKAIKDIESQKIQSTHAVEIESAITWSNNNCGNNKYGYFNQYALIKK